MKPEDDYVSVRIPRQLADGIDEIIRTGKLGYRTRAEVVKEAIRLRLHELKRNLTIPSPLEPERMVFINRERKRVAEVRLIEFEIEHINHVLGLPELRKFLRDRGYTLEMKKKL